MDEWMKFPVPTFTVYMIPIEATLDETSSPARETRRRVGEGKRRSRPAATFPSENPIIRTQEKGTPPSINL